MMPDPLILTIIIIIIFTWSQHLGEHACIVTYSNQELHFTGCFNVMTHYPLILTIIIIIIIRTYMYYNLQ